MVTIQEPGSEERTEILIDEEEDHDGWGPIRPRRSSNPPTMHTMHATEERDTLPILCTPLPEGLPDKR